MGSAVDSAHLTSELTQLAGAGFGGVEVTAIYGVKGAESQFVPYLTPRWNALLAHAATQAHRLGMGLDMPPGAGWRTGGATVTPADANKSLRITFDSAKGTHVAEMRFSGDNVKRPGPGGEGFAIDVFSRAATDNFLRTYAERLGPMPWGVIGAYFHDSFEYTGSGSSELFEFFLEHRRYDLRRELAALAGQGDPERIARVKSDYRQTLDEMLLANFLLPLREWSHARGSKSRNQAHGSPGNLLDLYAASDVPETEIFGRPSGNDEDILVAKFASSAAHVAGLPLASAESFTWLGEHFSATLDDVKQAADAFFLGGINHLIYHGTAYSPANVAWPGWEFYASAEFNPRNAFWRDLPVLNRYVARVQSVMQASHADNDVLLYWPVWDNWHDTTRLRMDFAVRNARWLFDKPVGAVATELWKTGYGFDYVSDRLLATSVNASGRRLRAGGAEYAAIVVPRAQHMPPETFQRLVELARSGATIAFLGSLPPDVPGLFELEARRAHLATARQQVRFGDADAVGVRAAPVGSGRLLVGEQLEPLLAASGIHRETMVDRPGVRFIRQRTVNGRQYFISHAGTESVDGWVSLASTATRVAIMDPMTGRTGLAEVRPGKAGGVDVRVHLDPGSSLILRTFDTRIDSPRWAYESAIGAPITLRGRWTVTFTSGGPTLPASFAIDSLTPWTGRGDANADRFAGSARYAMHFDAPSSARNHSLDLGRVAESARVRLNGRDLGTLIARPFRVATGPVRAKNNLLEIEVTNLSANRVHDLDVRGVSWKTFHDINYVGFDYRPFDASMWPVRVSGLVGPVTLTAIAPE